MTVRNWVKVVMYNATPGTFLRCLMVQVPWWRLIQASYRTRVALVPLHNPFRPLEATIPRAVCTIVPVLLDIGDDTNLVDNDFSLPSPCCILVLSTSTVSC